MRRSKIIKLLNKEEKTVSVKEVSLFPSHFTVNIMQFSLLIVLQKFLIISPVSFLMSKTVTIWILTVFPALDVECVTQ